MFQRPFIAFPKTPEKGADAAIRRRPAYLLHIGREREKARGGGISPLLLPRSSPAPAYGSRVVSHQTARSMESRELPQFGILAGVAVIEHFAEMGHVRPETLQILTAQGGGRLGEIRRRFLAHPGRRGLSQQGKMGHTQGGLLLEQAAEVPLLLPQAADGGQLPFHSPIYLSADKAAPRRLPRGFCLLPRAFAQQRRPGENLLFHLVEMAFQHERHAQAAAAAEHHPVVGEAKTLLVGFYAHIRLHHGRAGDIIRHPFL